MPLAGLDMLHNITIIRLVIIIEKNSRGKQETKKEKGGGSVFLNFMGYFGGNRFWP